MKLIIFIDIFCIILDNYEEIFASFSLNVKKLTVIKLLYFYVIYIYIYIYIYIHTHTHTVKKRNNFEVTGKTLEFLNFYNVKNLNILQ